MALPGLAQIGRMLADGAAASPNPRVRVDWNRFQDRLKCNTLRLCFADRPPALPLWQTQLFHFSRSLIDGIIGVFSVASATVLCFGVPIVVFRHRCISSEQSLTPWSTLNRIQEVMVRQSCTGSLFRSISLASLACASFVVDSSFGCPRLAITALLPNINGIIPHKAIAALPPLDRLFSRVLGACLSQILRAAFCSLCLSTKPSFTMFAAAFFSPLPQRMLGVLYLELGRVVLHMYPAVSQFAAGNSNAPVNNEDEHGEMPAQGARGAEDVHSDLARSGLVFHLNHLSMAPTAFIHERISTSLLINPLIFTSELRSWYKLLHAFNFVDQEFPGFFKRLLFGYWFTGCSGMLQNGCIASSLVLNELAAYLWGEE